MSHEGDHIQRIETEAGRAVDPLRFMYRWSDQAVVLSAQQVGRVQATGVHATWPCPTLRGAAQSTYALDSRLCGNDRVVATGPVCPRTDG
jgi:hypothetical protein